MVNGKTKGLDGERRVKISGSVPGDGKRDGRITEQTQFPAKPTGIGNGIGQRATRQNYQTNPIRLR